MESPRLFPKMDQPKIQKESHSLKTLKEQYQRVQEHTDKVFDAVDHLYEANQQLYEANQQLYDAMDRLGNLFAAMECGQNNGSYAKKESKDSALPS